MRIIEDTDPREVSAQLWAGLSGFGLGFDVGANCGQSLPAMLGACDRVVAFEPCAESFEVLAGRRDPRMAVVPVAISDVDGSVELAVLPHDIGYGSLVTAGAHGVPAGGEVRRVPARTLDSEAAAFGYPGLVKVDVEGHEGRVLAGAAGVIAAGCEWLIEWHSAALREECAAVLAAAGYVVAVIRHPHFRADDPLWDEIGWLRARR